MTNQCPGIKDIALAPCQNAVARGLRQRVWTKRRPVTALLDKARGNKLTDPSSSARAFSSEVETGSLKKTR